MAQEKRGTEEKRRTMAYRVLRYTPNLVRDEWLNIGIVLEDERGGRREVRLIEEPGEIARVRRLHPQADESFLRNLNSNLEMYLRRGKEGSGRADGSAGEDVHRDVGTPAKTNGDLLLKKLDDTLSNLVQFSPQRGVMADDFDVELDRLYRDYVALPRGSARGGVFENTRAWIRSKLSDVFRRQRILGKMEKGVRVEEFTQPGDPFRIDYGYRYNGTRGFVHAVSLGRDPAQAKVLAYTAECIRARMPKTEFNAITEVPISGDNPRHQFVSRLFEEQKISLVPLNRIERFAEELRPRLN
jgi:Protein of unknown function (DUF3037)